MSRWLKANSSLLLILFNVLTLVGVGVNFALITSDKITTAQTKQARFAIEIAQFKKLKFLKNPVDVALMHIDPDLPGISTAQTDFFLSQYRSAARQRDFQKAKRLLIMADKVAKDILSQQQLIIPQEVARLQDHVSRNLFEAEEILAKIDDLEQLYEDRKSEALDDRSRLNQLRSIMVELASRISERRLQSESAVKSVVVVKGDKKLKMYEDGNVVYEMPISLGRAGRRTQAGEFKILDKMERVWGYYRIWMPYWMGIYFAGSSENGLHGIPWDSAGHRYWEKDVGIRDVTYGCIMAKDDDMRKLFNWAQVGTPVTVID